MRRDPHCGIVCTLGQARLRDASRMPARTPPLLLMLALLALATSAARWRPASSSARPAAADASSQIENLQAQILKLQEENERMAQALIPLENPPSTEPEGEEPLDAVGLCLKFMALRQQPLAPLPCRAVPLADLERLILSWLRARLPGPQALARMQAWQAMGWVEQAVDPLPIQAALLARSVGGWYQPREQSLWIVQDPSRAIDPSLACALGPRLKALAAPQPSAAASDTLMAQLAALLGDAAHARNALELEQTAALPQGALPLEDPDHPFNQVEAAHLLREFTLQPMLWGLRRAQRLAQQGGWPALDAALLQPPTHCARLRDWPLSSASSVIGHPLPSAPTPSAQDRLGALALNCLLRTEVSDADADALSRGWVDDCLSLHPNDQRQAQACWRVQLQSPSQAAACARAAAAMILRRSQSRQAGGSGNRQDFQIGTRHAAVCWQESPPLLIWAEGAQAAFVNQVLPATGTGQR